MTSAHALLIHGSSHGAWCWDDVRTELTARGVRSTAIDLPGHGRRAAEAAGASGASYAAAVTDAIDAIGEPVLLVGHSMAGHVVARAASERPNAVRRLVLVNAQVLRDGETHASTLPPEMAEGIRQLAQSQGGVTFLLPPSEIHGRWLQDLDIDDPRVRRAQQLITPQPYGPVIEPVLGQDFAARGVPATYVRSRDDAGPPGRMDGFIAKLPKGTAVIEVPGGHDCMISEPGALAGVLAQLAMDRDPVRA